MITLNSDLGKILNQMKLSNKPMKVSDFFWYESGTRIWDLCRSGYVQHTSDEIWPKWQKFAKYELTKLWRDYIFPVETYIVKNWKPTKKILDYNDFFNNFDKFLWNTNIPNLNYKPTLWERVKLFFNL